jgi:SAM-dependent methyltransferase
VPTHPSSAEAEEIARFLQESGARAGARLLDAPCGLGRRAHGLAERGFLVTAVDPNEVAIQALRKRAGRSLADRLEYRSAPPASFPGLAPTERFDAILCLDHAISRDPPGEDVAFLRRLRGHLAPGGLLLLDLLHRDFFAARPRPFAYHVIGEIEQHEFRTFDAATGILDLTWKFYQRSGEDLRFRGTSAARLRLLSPHEAASLLETAGWKVEALHGGWGREPVSPDRRKILLVARPARG